MSEAWIAQLAAEIKQKDKEAAEDYARAEHYATVAVERGRGFFVETVICLQEYVDSLRRELQGDVTSAEMAAETVHAGEIKITRERFPWVDARLTHADDAVTLDYTKGAGTAGDAKQDRVTRAFRFRVTPEEKLRVEEAFTSEARSYETPEELARAVMEILFRAPVRADSLSAGEDTAGVEAA